MPKISFNIDDETQSWLTAQQKESGVSRTDIIQAVLKAAMNQEVSRAAPPVDQQPATMPLSFDGPDLKSLRFTLDAFLQRYLVDNPIDEKNADQRWADFERLREQFMSNGDSSC